MKQILITLSMAISGMAMAQSNFYKQYSSNGYDYAEGVAYLATSNEFLVTGSSSSFSEAPSQMYVLKLDSAGEWLWSRHFGGPEADGGKRILVLADGSYYVGGYSQSGDTTSYDIAVWYFDANDELQWNKAFGTNAYDNLLDMTLSADGGLVLLGETWNTTDGFSDELIIRIDSAGDELWRNQIELPLVNRSYSIKYHDATHFIVVGEKYEVADERRSSVIYQINAVDGSVANEWTVRTGIASAFNDVYFTDPTTLFIAGEYVNVNEVMGSGWYKFNLTTGTVETEELNSSNMNARSVGLVRYEGEMAVALQHNGEYSHGQWDIDVHHAIDPFNWIQSLVGINHLSNQVYGQMISLPDHGFVLVGSNSDWGSGGSTIFIVRKAPGTPFYQPTTFNGWQPLVSVDEVSEGELFSIYPNPTNDKWIIQLEEGDYVVKVFSLDGRLQLETKTTSSRMIDVTELSTGNYIIEVTNQETLIKGIRKGVKL